FFPREVCPGCGLSDLQWVQPSGLGSVYAVTTVRRKQESGGDYNVSLIDLDEGVRLMSRVEGLAPSVVYIGMRVQSRVLLEDGRSIVVFDPLEESLP
ncbi:MAG: Nucleic-acid-binding protein containing a Zn-ribbon, partial [Hymenobacter sp.]|nr:Nucleic-acid-binding protein containing a Zn-ribbon [Hymenobacter sp.]